MPIDLGGGGGVQTDALTAYRQALRDWPSTADFPDTKPVLGS